MSSVLTAKWWNTFSCLHFALLFWTKKSPNESESPGQAIEKSLAARKEDKTRKPTCPDKKKKEREWWHE